MVVRDQSVFNTAYQVVESRNVPHVIQLAWAEAGLVESNFTNHLTATNYDSLGYLQQRPSQGWANPTNVTTATNSFLDKAVAYYKTHPNATAAEIAQAVQVSAFPDRYNERQAEALALLQKANPDSTALDVFTASLGLPASPGIPGLEDSVVSAALGALLERIGKAADAFTSKAKIAESIVTSVTKLFLPSNLLRVAAGGIGVIVLCFSVFFLGRELNA